MAKILAARRGRVLVDEGYRYQLNQKRPNSYYWRCTQTDCRKTLHTDVFDIGDPTANINVTRVDVHNHKPDKNQVRLDVLVNKLQKKIRDEPIVPVRKKYDSVLTEEHREASAVEAMVVPAPQLFEGPTLGLVGASSKRSRTSHLPPVLDDLQSEMPSINSPRTKAYDMDVVVKENVKLKADNKTLNTQLEAAVQRLDTASSELEHVRSALLQHSASLRKEVQLPESPESLKTKKPNRENNGRSKYYSFRIKHEEI